mmetsp:Transcript_44015/g.93633  ORF Transcript_44015/g.93633 Transcript_44015/m.93633 type:complete len:252 (+) Transcript_44015:191-946(+)
MNPSPQQPGPPQGRPARSAKGNGAQATRTQPPVTRSHEKGSHNTATCHAQPRDTLYLSFKVATPGKFFPSNSSREAPPPVDTWVTLSSVPYFLAQVAVSPPPITATLPAAQAATKASIMDLVPVSNLVISNTPMGPFQIMVLEPAMTAAFILQVSGPQSKPMNPSGIPSSFVAAFTSPSSPNLLETTKSTGKLISTFLALASSMISFTILAPSSSNKDDPMETLSKTFRKVYAIPPPMIIRSTLSSMVLMS